MSDIRNVVEEVKIKKSTGELINPATEESVDGLETKLDTIISDLNSLEYTKNYSVRIDEASATVTYFGFAVAGGAEGSAIWRIKRMTVTGTVTDVKYADGNTEFDNIWSNRAALSYS